MLSKTGSGAQDYLAGNIGNASLRQYKVTLDYGNGAVYLAGDPSYRPDSDWTYRSDRKASKNRGESGNLGFSGLRRRSGGPVEIMGIAPGGATARAGVRRGDWILAVDGAVVEDLTREKLLNRLGAGPGTTVRLTIRHGDATREVTLITQ